MKALDQERRHRWLGHREFTNLEGWGQDLCRFTDGRRPCVSYWWRCGAWCFLLGGDVVAGWVFYVDSLLSGLLQSSKMLKINFTTGSCVNVCGLHIGWEGISCVFLEKYVKLYLPQRAGHPFPLFHYVPCQVCLGQTRMISSCIRQSHSTETQHIVQTTACF